MNISQLILMLMNSANTLEREVVCNDDFDGNDDVTDAIEDIRNVAKSLKSLTGADYKEKTKKEEHARAIEAIMNTNASNKEFQYFFAYTTGKDDSIRCYGCCDFNFEANLAVELATRASRHMVNPLVFADRIVDSIADLCVDSIMGDDDDD